MLASEIIQDSSGVKRCHRVIKQAIPSGDGKKQVLADTYCNQPVALSIATKQMTCPRCEKEPAIGWISPRITNTATVADSAMRLKNGLPALAMKEPEEGVAPVVRRKKREVNLAVEAKVKKEIRKDVVLLEVPLSVLEGNSDVAAVLIQKTIDAFGELPVTNFNESKRLIKLEEKMRSLLGA